MTKLELKKYRDNLILSQYKSGIGVEELAYVYNISSRRISDILKGLGVSVKVDSKKAEEMKSTKVVSKKL
jgi:Mor family transcriptional regulator